MNTQEIQVIRSVFEETRKELNGFFEDREFKLSNAQIFTFLSFCPNALAIASDGKVDESEIIALEKISRSIDVRNMVSIEMFEMMAYAPEPDDSIINEEFNMRAGSELLYLSRNMKKYESNFLNALKALLKFDANPAAVGSMSSSFIAMMNAIVENNLSLEKDKEFEKLKEIQLKLGLITA